MVELVAANTRLSEVLATSQTDLLARADSFNTGEAASWRRCAHWMIALNIALVIIGAVGAYLLVKRVDALEANSTVAVQQALEADTRARTEEMTRAKFQEDQEKFNEATLKAFEEIKKKWTPSTTKPKR